MAAAREDEFDFEPKQTIRERFEEFHRSHPGVFRAFVRFARQVKSNGKVWTSADYILHRVRFWSEEEGGSNEPGVGRVKMNNNFSTHYAEVAMEKCEDLKGFFRRRRRKSE